MTDGELDPRGSGCFSLYAKATELMALTSESRNDPQHREGFEDDGHGLPLESTHVLQTRNNARAVYTDGVVDDRYHRKREKCKYRIEPDRNGEHCCEGDETLK